MWLRRIRPGEKFDKGIHEDRRASGIADRRKQKQKPIERAPGKGWSVGPDPHYARRNPITGEITIAPEGRTSGQEDRRQKKK